ncbi:hypothetical protein Taro_039970 [Colocasia esculenta]|uniref:Uncharacterized protein n=1 Tax=Colocasia esculenta TaxID=4460 RepID=A0A843WAP0_COLES|nr:hypothetical protein [Colocasia esculenta]
MLMVLAKGILGNVEAVVVLEILRAINKNRVRPGEVAIPGAQLEDLKPIQNGVVVLRLGARVRVESHPKILLFRAISNDHNIVPIHRAADCPAEGDHVRVLGSSLVVEVDGEDPLVDLGERVLDLAEVHPHQVDESWVDREQPGEVVGKVDAGVRPHGSRRAVDLLGGGVVRHLGVPDDDVGVLAIGNPGRSAEDVGGVVSPGPEEVHVVDGGDGVPAHVQPVHGLQRRGLVDRVRRGQANDGEDLGAEEVGRGDDLDAVHKGVGVGDASRRCEGKVEEAPLDADGELPDDVGSVEDPGGLGGAEVAKQGDVARIGSDGEAVEVEADELAAGRDGKGVGEGGPGDSGGHVGDLRDGGVLRGGGGCQVAVVLVELPAGGPAVEEDVVADDEGEVPGGGLAGEEEDGGGEEEGGGDGEEKLAPVGAWCHHGDPTQNPRMVSYPRCNTSAFFFSSFSLLQWNSNRRKELVEF